MLGYEAMRSQKPGLLGPVEEEDQVGDKFGFSQDDDARHLGTRLERLEKSRDYFEPQCNRDCTKLTIILDT